MLIGESKVEREHVIDDGAASFPFLFYYSSPRIAALPDLAWLQIVLVVALLDNSVVAQDPSKAPGDVADGTYVGQGSIWVRYDDVPGFTGKQWKLNAERNNGRAAMMGIIGCMIHEGLTGNPVWPIPIPPQPVLEVRHPSARRGMGAWDGGGGQAP